MWGDSADLKGVRSLRFVCVVEWIDRSVFILVKIDIFLATADELIESALGCCIWDGLTGHLFCVKGDCLGGGNLLAEGG
jgi:hypothetical protein